MGQPLELPIGRVVDLDNERVRRFRPAYRFYLLQWLAIVVGLPTALLPKGVILALAGLINLGLEPGSGLSLSALNEAGQSVAINAVQITGFALFFWGMMRIAYGRVANRFLGSADLIAKEFGIIARKRNQINLNHVRVVDVQQGFVERLLNIGRLEFSTAGTAGVDVIWHGVVSPAKIQAIIQDTMNGGYDAPAEPAPSPSAPVEQAPPEISPEPAAAPTPTPPAQEAEPETEPPPGVMVQPRRRPAPGDEQD
jgi:hypothetical protein